MSKVFFFVAMSLDGYIAPAGMDMEHADDPNYNDWADQWGQLQSWVFQQKFFRSLHASRFNSQWGHKSYTKEDGDYSNRTSHR